jgi:hypothetical protein
MASETVATESVWDYPRRPRVEERGKHIRIVFNGVVIADTLRAKRVLRALQMARLKASFLPGTQPLLRALQMARLEASSLPGTQPLLRALQMARLEASSLPGTQDW